MLHSNRRTERKKAERQFESLEMFLFCIVKQNTTYPPGVRVTVPARPATVSSWDLHFDQFKRKTCSAFTRKLKTPDWSSLTGGGKRGYSNSLQHVGTLMTSLQRMNGPPPRPSGQLPSETSQEKRP